MIRPDLRDLINDHKPTTESNNEENEENEEENEENEEENEENEENDSDNDRADWKIQLVMQNSCISTKNIEETHTIYSASEPV